MLNNRINVHGYVREGKLVRQRGIEKLCRESVGLYKFQFPTDGHLSLDEYHFTITVLNSDAPRFPQLWAWDSGTLQVTIWDACGCPADADFMIGGQRVAR